MKQKLHNLLKIKKPIKPVIFGLKSTELNDEEKLFFQKENPIGFILFTRNILNKIQLKKLVKSLKTLLGRDCLILIDQEGGRVQRLKEPHWEKHPSALSFEKIYKLNKEKAKREVFKTYKKIAQELKELGINVNCAPNLDILTKETSQAIGDRAFGYNAETVSTLGKEACKALISENIFPIIKHIPGHGRAKTDSHFELPIINTKKSELLETDFAPFIKLKNNLLAMVAHILYTDIDDKNPATLSKKAISTIRKDIGFKGILITDDISMKALKGNLGDIIKKSIKAGCDIILHCNGKMNEMQEIAKNLEFISSRELRF